MLEKPKIGIIKLPQNMVAQRKVKCLVKTSHKSQIPSGTISCVSPSKMLKTNLYEQEPQPANLAEIVFFNINY